MKLEDSIRKKLFKQWNGLLVDVYREDLLKMTEHIYDKMNEHIGDTNKQEGYDNRNPQEYEYFQREWVTTILMEVEKLIDTDKIESWISGVHLNQNGIKTYDGEDRTFEEMKHNPNWKQLESKLDDYFKRNPQWKK